MWDTLQSDESIERTAGALRANNIAAEVFDRTDAVKAHVMSMLPDGASVLTSTSVTLDAIGISNEINESAKYVSFKKQIFGITDKASHLVERRRLVNPDYVIGSAHAITETGSIYVASGSGSQIAPYAYSAAHLMLIVGAQKIVKSDADAIRRIEEHCVPLEDARAMKAYGRGTSFNKLLVIRKEGTPGRTSVIFVRKVIGF